MTIKRISALLFFLAALIPAFAQSEPRAIQEEDKLARPVNVIAPWLPKREAADKFPVEIRISGSVSESGEMESPVFSPPEGNEKFIRAIQEVLPYWRFRPAIDRESCGPVRSQGVVTVWFEEKDGKPSVWVSSPAKANATSVPDDGKPPVQPRVYESSPTTKFPRAAWRAGMEGEAVLLFKVNNQGDVVQTKLLYSAPDKLFGRAALEGSTGIKFSSAPPDADAQKSVCIFVPFVFCLPGGAKHPITACANKDADVRK